MGAMTKHVLVARHAEAGSTPWGGTDRDRELSADGVRQAQQLGRRIAAGELPTPELALTSDATRAVQTWRAAAEAGGVQVEHRAEPDLYDGSVDALVDAVRSLDEAVASVVLVAHAPDVPALVGQVQDARSEPTPLWGWAPGTVGVLELDGPWADFPDAARLVAVVVNEGD